MAAKAFTWPGERQNDPSHRRLAEFLVMDIQHSPEWTRDLLDQIILVQSGGLEQWERLGNVFHLQLSSEGATITDLIDDHSSAIIPLEDFYQAVLTWLEQVQ